MCNRTTPLCQALVCGHTRATRTHDFVCFIAHTHGVARVRVVNPTVIMCTIMIDELNATPARLRWFLATVSLPH